MTDPTPITRAETKARLRVDRERLLQLLREVHGDDAARVGLHPSYICVWLHRWSHHHYRNGRRWFARFLWHLNTLLTGADIAEICDLGPGLLIPSPAGVAIMAKAGCNLTVMPCAGLGGEMPSCEDIGAGPGLPLVGDDVTLDAHAGILGPTRIGDRVRIDALACASRDTPSDHRVLSPRFRTLERGVTA